MTDEELKELKEYFEAVIKDNDRRALRSDEEEQVLELINSEIARKSVTDEDVQRAIEFLKEEYESSIQAYKYSECEENMQYWGKQATLAITALQQLNKEPQWISVEDRLPEEHTNILVALKNGAVFKAEFRIRDFVIVHSQGYDYFYEHNPVTRWMPLPKPPKES